VNHLSTSLVAGWYFCFHCMEFTWAPSRMVGNLAMLLLVFDIFARLALFFPTLT
jgi:hypothetical protein